MCPARQPHILCGVQTDAMDLRWSLLSSRNEIWLGGKLKLKVDTSEMRSQGSRGAATASESRTIHVESLWHSLQFTELTAWLDVVKTSCVPPLTTVKLPCLLMHFVFFSL
jgi:hypothetical protein